MFVRRQIILLVVLIIVCNVPAQEPVTVAVLDLEMLTGVPETYQGALSEILREEFFHTGRFRVIERNNMEDILTEQGFQFSGCTSDECAVEVGQLLGVQQMIAGSISKLGELHTVSLRLIDVETGEVLDMQSARCRCSIEEVAETSLADAAQAITGKGNVSRQSTTGRQVVGVHYRGCGSYGFPVVVL